MVFALLICLATAFASSAAPLLFVLRSDLQETLREGGRSGRAGVRSHGLRGALVVSEVALALLVLIGAGLFSQSYRKANAIDPGFNRDGVLLANLPIASGGYSVAELENFCQRFREHLGPAPGIEEVSFADYAPLWSTDGPYANTRPEGYIPRDPEELKVHATSVAPGYFGVLKIPLLEGRDFTESDIRTSPLVMIVDQAFAKRFCGGASPIGRRVEVRRKFYTIVGLVRDSKYFSFTETPRPHFYLPFRQSYRAGQQIVFFVRTKGDPEASIPTLRRVAAATDPYASGFTAAPMTEYNALLLLPRKVAASLLSFLGVIAFLLAGVGLYGVVSYSVSQRTQELGIRIALGARPHEVLGTVMREGIVLTAAGVAIGLGLSVVTMRLVSGLLFAVSPFDPGTFASASLFLAAVAAAASILPARRASRLDPFTALRAE
jgi:predicted permease